MNIQCPDCGSTDLMKTSLVHEQGTTHSSGFTSGIVGVKGGFGFGLGSHASTHVTSTAQRAAPPRKVLGCAAMVTFVFAETMALFDMWDIYRLPSDPLQSIFWLIVNTVLGLVTFRIVLKMWAKDKKYNREQLPELYAAWQRSFMCSRCGRIGDPARVQSKGAASA